MNNKPNEVLIPKRVVKRKLLSVITIVLLICSGLLIFLTTTPNITSVTAASTWTQSSDTDFVHGTFNNVKIDGRGENAELRLAQEKVWINKKSINKPPIRYSHGMVSIEDPDNFLLYGGFGDNYLDDTWIYNTSMNEWKKNIPLSPTGGRFSFGMASLWGTNDVVLFGGDTPCGCLHAETWTFDFITKTWTKIGPPWFPSGRVSTSMISLSGTDNVLLFGGGDWSLDSETWIYDYSDNNWTLINTINNPSPRKSHAMAPIPNTDKIMLFGGEIGGSHPNYIHSDETWIYDVSESRWTNETNDKKPKARGGHSMATIWGTNKILLFGGTDGVGYFNDTWMYSFSDNSWTEIKYSIGPVGRMGHTLASDYKTHSIVLFGGYDGDDYLNDTWIFNPNYLTENGTYISSPYDTGKNSTFSTLSWSATTPIDTTIKFQLRSADNEPNLTRKAFIGPGGSAKSFYKTSGSQIWSGHSGNRWIQYKIYFNTTNQDELASLKDVTITYNCWPDTIPIAPANGSIISNSKPFFKWQLNDDSKEQAEYQVLIDNDYNFNNIDFDTKAQYSTIQRWEFPEWTRYSKIPDGTWYWKVRIKDSDGDWGPYCAPCEFTIDTIPPSSLINIPINNQFYNYLDNISGTATDYGSVTGIWKVEILIERLNDNYYWDGSDWTQYETWLLTYGTSEWIYDPIFITWTSGEQYIIRSKAFDFASNVEIPGEGIIINIDTEKPISTIDVPINKSYLNNMSIISGNSIDAGGSGIDQVKITIKCEEDNKYWNGNVWVTEKFWLSLLANKTWTYNASNIPLTNGAKYTICSRAFDKVGNREFPGTKKSFIFDSQPPVNLAILINDGDKYANSTQVVLSLFSIDEISAVSEMRFSNDNINWTSWEKFVTTKSFPLQKGDGEKFVYFKTLDSADNIAEPVSDSIILDTTPPQNLSILINNGAKKTNSTIITLILGAIDNISGVDQMSVSNDGISWDYWENFKEKLTFKLPPGEGEKTVYFRVKDKVGNIAKPVLATIELSISSDSDYDKPEKNKPESDNIFESGEIWINLAFLIIFIIIVTFLILLIFLKKRRKQTIPETKTITIKPSQKSKHEMIVDHITLTPKTTQVQRITLIPIPQQTTIQKPSQLPPPQPKPASSPQVQPQPRISPEQKVKSEQSQVTVEKNSNIK